MIQMVGQIVFAVCSEIGIKRGCLLRQPPYIYWRKLMRKTAYSPNGKLYLLTLARFYWICRNGRQFYRICF